MPPQCSRIAPQAGAAPASPATRRLAGLFAATLALTALSLTPVYQVLAADTLGPLDALILALVALLFAWTAFSFLSGLAGFLAGRHPCALGLDHHGPPPTLDSRTAVLLPVYNEAPRPVVARLAGDVGIDRRRRGRARTSISTCSATPPTRPCAPRRRRALPT